MFAAKKGTGEGPSFFGSNILQTKIANWGEVVEEFPTSIGADQQTPRILARSSHQSMQATTHQDAADVDQDGPLHK